MPSAPGPSALPAAAPSTAPQPSSGSAPDKDAPLMEDIRLLGRLLGEVIHEQEGAAAFELIEHIRQ
ncbi:MAG: hypothetical protein U1D28_05510, partial [Burkholderiales bacterium]|nr:hypothetical protein [Burkholderiales bacterium]